MEANSDRRSTQGLHHLFERQAARTPDRVAATWGDRALTFRELDAMAAETARRLGRRAVVRGDLVALLLERSPEMLAAVLAVLRSGAAFLPLDPAHPPARHRLMLQDSGATVVLATAALAQTLPPSPPILLIPDEPDPQPAAGPDPGTGTEPGAGPQDLAYVIYTSGSTGTPKGVMVPHAAAANAVAAAAGRYRLGPGDRVLQFASLAFDVAVEEIFAPWATGGAVVLFPGRPTASMPDVLEEVRRREVSLLNLSTPLWEQWVSEMGDGGAEVPPSLRTVVIGGERASVSSLRRWTALAGRGIRLVNAYGTTETAITSTAWDAGEEVPAGAATVPIGRPLAGAQVMVLGPDLRPVRQGETGELHVAGAGLARGYLGRPDRTAERFVPDPFGPPGARMYATGDLARELPDGNLEFLGRMDDQVKVSGFRIEPGEIESALLAVPWVTRASVRVWEGPRGGGRLAAYVTASDRDRPTRELRAHLQAVLPAHMVPASFTVLDRMPLTPGGKVDRALLPPPPLVRPDLKHPFRPPGDETERTIAGIWEDVLAVRPLGATDGFIELGGSSLMAARILARVRDAVGAEVSLGAFFAHPTVEGLAGAARAAQGVASALPPLAPGPRDEAPLSFSQEQVWFLDRLSPGSLAYNTQTTFRFRGPLDHGLLEEAVTEIVRRHDILRTTFPARAGRGVQVVHPPYRVSIPLVDLRDVPEPDREARAEALVQQELRRPFDVSRLPLLRWTLLRLGHQEHELILVEHHLVHDGWSFTVLVGELKAAYSALAEGRPPSPPELPELPAQYGDFARWQRAAIDGPAMRGQLERWKRRLAGAPDRLDLPTDRPRPHRQTFGGGAERVELPLDLCDAVRTFGRTEGVTLFTTLVAAFAALMHRHAGQEDLCVGSGFANRRVPGTEGMLGMLVNPVVLRFDLGGDPSFRELLRRARDVVLEAHEDQEFPFAALVQELNPHRDQAQNPIFQVAFSFDDSPLTELSFAGAAGRMLERHNGSAKLDLNVVVAPRAEKQAGTGAEPTDRRITLIWEYNGDLFDAATVRRMVEHFRELLEHGIAEPDRRVSELQVASEAERRLVVREWNRTAAHYPRDRSIHDLFAERARLAPNATAVAHGEERIAYAELAALANGLARRLVEASVGPGARVAVCAERSPALVIALLAVLEAGGAYVALDPDHPKARLDFVLRDTGATVVLAEPRLLDRMPSTGATAIPLEPRPSPDGRLDLGRRAGPGDVAYVCYTSGSTGTPKGVMVTHRNVLRLLFGAGYADFGPGRATLAAAPASFDASTFEIWGPLLHGGTCVLHPERVPDPHSLGETILAHRVDTAWLTASLFNAVLDRAPESLEPLSQLLVGGEALSVPHVRRALERLAHTRIVNGYGPTETTTFACCHRVTGPLPDGVRSIPIGRPIANTTAYVLDPAMAPVGIGVPGELYLGGDGVALGYLGRPALTASRFVPDPFAQEAGSRLYRTGDLVRWLPGGVLEFLGRLDDQVKVHGFRIEPGEVEAALLAHPDVAGAVVAAKGEGPGERHLVAYVVGRDAVPPPPRADLLRFLRARLPAYMVPTAVVRLDELPLTSSGKVDRRALPEAAAEPVRDRPPGSYRPPQSETELLVAEIWAAALKRDRTGGGGPFGGGAGAGGPFAAGDAFGNGERAGAAEDMGAEDDFFELGGHSLLALDILAGVEERFGVRVPLATMFERPTIAGLAAAVEEELLRSVDEDEIDELLGPGDSGTGPPGSGRNGRTGPPAPSRNAP